MEQENFDSSAEHGDAQQADKPGDVSNEGRSLRSSPSAGEPRTRRREAEGEDTAPPAQGQAMYVASTPGKEWLLNVQRCLYTRSWNNPPYHIASCGVW